MFDEKHKIELWKDTFKNSLIYMELKNLRELARINNKTIERCREELENPELNKFDTYLTKQRIEHCQERKEICQKQIEIHDKVESEFSETEQSSSPNLSKLFLVGIVVLFTFFISKYF